MQQQSEKILATRDGFGVAMLELGEMNSKVVALSADLTESMRLDVFKKTFPDRFVDVGVAEQNMVGVAAGLAMTGKIPFAASFAVFSPARSWEQIRVSVCYSNLNVKIVGGHTGVSVGADGATHQALEDIALMRVLPNMTVVVPCDYHQAVAATKALAAHTGPCYLRLGRAASPYSTTALTPFTIGKAQILAGGESSAENPAQLTLIATGSMVAPALEAHTQLAQQGIKTTVINMHTIKPLDTQVLDEAAKNSKTIITIEEHQQAGGLGSAVAEYLSQTHPTKIKMIAMQDSFGESGTEQELLKKYGFTATHIVNAAQEVLH